MNIAQVARKRENGREREKRRNKGREKRGKRERRGNMLSLLIRRKKNSKNSNELLTTL